MLLRVAKRQRSKSAVRVKRSKKPKHRAMTLNRNVIPTIVARVQRVVMVYSQTDTYTAVGGADQDYFRMNSIYDPDEIGVGYQPAGHDQWATFYSRYLVIRGKADLHILNSNATDSCTVGAAYVVEAPGTNVNQICNLSGAKTLLLTPLSGSGSKGHLSFPWVYGKTVTGDPDYETSADYAAAFGSNPARIWRFAYSMNNTGATALAITTRVTLSYDVLMYQPITLAAS